METGIQQEIGDFSCISTQALNLLFFFPLPTFLLVLEVREHNCGATDP